MATKKRPDRLIHSNVEFFGAAELYKVKAKAGLRIQRIPEKVRSVLNPKAQQRMLAPDGVEIRFVTSGETVSVILSAPDGPCEVFPFWGGFGDCQTRENRLIVGPKPTTFKLTYPEMVKKLKPGVCKNHLFKPQLWRLMLMSRCFAPQIYFHNIKGRCLRPPRPSELPRKCYLAYGTSITDGFVATAPYLTYVYQAAHRLGVDSVNLGSAGSAHCEPELADYIASRKDWDLATLGLSLNMIGANYTVEQFCQRASYMVNTIAGSDTSRPIFCITLWMYFGDLCRNIEGPHGKGLANPYREALRRIVKDCPWPNVHLLEGPDLLKDIDGHSTDIAHPSDLGMIQIGENLANQIKKLMAPMA